MMANIFQCLYAAGYYARSTCFDDIVKNFAGPHLNIRRAAMRPAGRRLDIPALKHGIFLKNISGYDFYIIFYLTSTSQSQVSVKIFQSNCRSGLHSIIKIW